MIRKRKLFVRPKKAFEKQRILEENQLLKTYGLKNKHELWKTLAKINYLRRRAMTLSSNPEEQEVLFNKLKNLGLKINTTSDVLDLKPEDLLKRRLPTIVSKKKLASTVKQARQMVTHKKIQINEAVVNSPSYLVSVSEENAIKLKEKKQTKQVKAKEPEVQKIQEEQEIKEEQKESKEEAKE